MKTGETNISVHSGFYSEWDSDEEWAECWSCYGTGMDRDEIYDCAVCWGEGEVRVDIPENMSEISIEQPLTSTSSR